ncbi:hypothetical protein DPM19_07280 [Actinomadura craniellae]|uniref:DUF397 domain-containing protein n=1 Tax=Actinomadura craniellae TaxID=2231787 RepID=A0A365H998_9ACTN|nr:DUF397 domain-containing protein [Actinomadura craniellae]RAY15588.1 hypothetical protein DPM19_07280 [Actinomadura craniellae]
MRVPQWRKASRSGGTDNSECVEVADLGGVIGIRDSKDPDGPQLALPADSFAALLARMKCDQKRAVFIEDMEDGLIGRRALESIVAGEPVLDWCEVKAEL